jgi:hypothetical protein
MAKMKKGEKDLSEAPQVCTNAGAQQESSLEVAIASDSACKSNSHWNFIFYLFIECDFAVSHSIKLDFSASMMPLVHRRRLVHRHCLAHWRLLVHLKTSIE